MVGKIVKTCFMPSRQKFLDSFWGVQPIKFIVLCERQEKERGRRETETGNIYALSTSHLNLTRIYASQLCTESAGRVGMRDAPERVIFLRELYLCVCLYV